MQLKMKFKIDNYLKKVYFMLFLIVFLNFININSVFAQFDESTGTILPKLSEEDAPNCDILLQTFSQYDKIEGNNATPILACAVKTGRVSLAMIPYFIKYISNFVLGLVGLISLLFVVLGGLFYTFGGLTENKDKGKKFITNALIGLVLAIMAWSIVNVLINAITG